MDFGLGLLGYHGCWDDAAFAEAHGFATAGFVDSPLLAGDPFVSMALTAERTDIIRVGTFLAIPSSRNAATTASAAATVNRIAPGRAFVGIGTGFTGRATFGLPRLSARRLGEYAEQCRGLLAGNEVLHTEGERERWIRFAHDRDRHTDSEHTIPIYIAADGPLALAVAGVFGDGWIITLQYANVMQNAPDVFASARATLEESAAAVGRSLSDAYNTYSACICLLEDGESAVSPRALEQVGMAAMMPFHAYADDPSIAAHLPPPLQDRIEIYEREVLSRFGGPRERIYQHTHGGHLSHLLEGEASVLTDEIVRMTTLTGTPAEVAGVLRGLEAQGLRNVSFWIPPHLTRQVVLEIEEKLMPLMAGASA